MPGRSRSKWLPWVAALLGMLLTARLGVWQLARAEQKQALQARIQQRGGLPPLTPADLPARADTAAAQFYRPVLLSGHWLAQHTVYLDNRQMNGRPGFFVLTPLRLADGTAVVVQRGWLPRDFVDRSRLMAVATPAGEVQVRGRLAPPPSRLLALGAADAGLIRQNIDLDGWALEIHQPLRPMSVQQLDAAPAASAALPSRPSAVPAPSASTAAAAPADGLLRQWPAPALDVAKHHGYAFQWFSLCAVIAGLAGWFLILRPRRALRNDPR